jgi:hypothetical protein
MAAEAQKEVLRLWFKITEARAARQSSADHERALADLGFVVLPDDTLESID